MACFHLDKNCTNSRCGAGGGDILRDEDSALKDFFPHRESSEIPCAAPRPQRHGAAAEGALRRPVSQSGSGEPSGRRCWRFPPLLTLPSLGDPWGPHRPQGAPHSEKAEGHPGVPTPYRQNHHRALPALCPAPRLPPRRALAQPQLCPAAAPSPPSPRLPPFPSSPLRRSELPTAPLPLAARCSLPADGRRPDGRQPRPARPQLRRCGRGGQREPLGACAPLLRASHGVLSVSTAACPHGTRVAPSRSPRYAHCHRTLLLCPLVCSFIHSCTAREAGATRQLLVRQASIEQTAFPVSLTVSCFVNSKIILRNYKTIKLGDCCLLFA